MQTTQYSHLRIAVLVALLAASAGCAAQTQLQPPPDAAQTPPPVAADAPPPPVAGSTMPPPPVAGSTMPPPPPVAGSTMPPPPPVAGAPLPPPPNAAPGPLADAASLSTAQGTVTRFLTNPDGDVDGFMTNDGMLVRFPPHMSAQLTAAVRPGDAVQMSGTRDESGTFAARSITDTRSGRQVIDEPPMRSVPPMPRAARGEGLSRLSAQGRVAHVTTAPRGEPDGVILADGTVIKLPPPVAQQFATLIRTGATVSAQGYGTRNQYGTAFQATSFGSPGKLTPLYDRAAPMP